MVTAVTLGVLTAHAGAGTFAPTTDSVAIDTELLDRIRTRLLAFPRYLQQTRDVLDLLMQGERAAAGSEAQRAAQWLLPTTARGTFSPFNTLADLVILLGFHSTLLWCILALLKERRSFTPITEFLLLCYCLSMLLMVGLGWVFGQSFSAGLWAEVIGIPMLIVALAFLFCWVFALRPGKALAAAALTAALSLGIAALLV